MGTNVDNQTADARALPFPATFGKPVDVKDLSGRLSLPEDSADRFSRFLLEETDCGFKGRFGYDTDLSEANTIQSFLQHSRIFR